MDYFSTCILLLSLFHPIFFFIPIGVFSILWLFDYNRTTKVKFLVFAQKNREVDSDKNITQTVSCGSCLVIIWDLFAASWPSFAIIVGAN